MQLQPWTSIKCAGATVTQVSILRMSYGRGQILQPIVL
jgi:hypothetical protein